MENKVKKKTVNTNLLPYCNDEDSLFRMEGEYRRLPPEISYLKKPPQFNAKSDYGELPAVILYFQSEKSKYELMKIIGYKNRKVKKLDGEKILRLLKSEGGKR